MEVAELCVPVVIAVAGFMWNDHLSRKAARRGIRTNYLLTAYAAIESASNRPLDPATARTLEAALADVQLLGNAAQVEAAHRFSYRIANGDGADAGLLLNLLRDDLRRELKLKKVPARRIHLRMSVDTGPADNS